MNAGDVWIDELEGKAIPDRSMDRYATVWFGDGSSAQAYCPTFLLRPFGAYRNLIPMAKNTVPREALLALTNMRANQKRRT
jgi:hypothetical protein